MCKLAERKAELVDYFEKRKDLHVSVCTDIWSDNTQTHSYMGVTCHWIDECFLTQTSTNISSF